MVKLEKTLTHTLFLVKLWKKPKSRCVDGETLELVLKWTLSFNIINIKAAWSRLKLTISPNSSYCLLSGLSLASASLFLWSKFMRIKWNQKRIIFTILSTWFQIFFTFADISYDALMINLGCNSFEKSQNQVLSA